MFHVSDNEQVYVIHADEKNGIKAERFGKIAFAVIDEKTAFNAENSAQFDKIIASVQQSRDNTLVLDLVYTDISISQMQKAGISALVVFANHIPEIFASLNVKIGIPFSVSGMAIFIATDLQNLQKSTPAKLLLWNFMKPQIG
ncbi:MAG TPA: hypothetical protein VGB95_04410 [Chitinophagales bacterium]